MLSANEEYQASFESVLADVDFRVQLSRTILEAEARKAGLLARVPAVLDAALTQAGLNLADVDVVEVIGGGVRMPIVQAALKSHLAAKATAGADVPLGVHLNGDEAAALGAAFLAANRSSSFRVRAVGMVDAYPWPVGVRLTHLNATAAAATTATPAADATDGGDEHGATKAWTKRSSLFRAYNALESVKRISFPAEKDLRAALFYEATPASGAAPMPEGTNRVLAVYNVTGIEALLASEALTARPNITGCVCGWVGVGRGAHTRRGGRPRTPATLFTPSCPPPPSQAARPRSTSPSSSTATLATSGWWWNGRPHSSAFSWKKLSSS